MYNVGDRFIMKNAKGTFGYEIIDISHGRITLKPDDKQKLPATTDARGLDLHIRTGIFKKEESRTPAIQN